MKKKGYTLIELIVVISIISLLMSIVLIKFDTIKKVKEKNEIKTMLADINYCKQKARVTGVRYGFAIKGPKTYSIVRTDDSIDGEGIQKVKKTIELELLEFTKFEEKYSEENPNEITFVPSGSVNKAQSVYISGLYSNYVLSVGVAGANTRIYKK